MRTPRMTRMWNRGRLVLLKAAVGVLARWKRVRFPARTLGGDEWVYRWRLDFLLGRYESGTRIWCERLLRPGMIALDIGAHIGYYTRLLARRVQEKGRVLAFEPCYENYVVLQYNVPPVRFKNVWIFDKAVSSRNGQALLFISPGHSNHSLIAGYTEAQGQVEVETVALDSFLPRYGILQVDFVKIDVEGGEVQALEGMRQTVRRSLPGLHMIVELNPMALRAGGYSPGELLHFLEEMGFWPYRIGPDGSLGEVDVGSDEAVNLLCVPKR
jgi:FkbM family methyltransferase